MVCLYCGEKTLVINSRNQKRPNQVWRRRLCQSCKNVFTTLEGADFSSAFRFRNQNGHLEPFQRDKLLISIFDSVRHRKNAYAAASALTQTVLTKLRAQFKSAVVDRSDLINLTRMTLKRFDRQAAVIYQAYHSKP